MVRIGIICPSEIAYRRFMPELEKVKGAEFAGIGVHSLEERFGGGMEYDSSCIKTVRKQREKAEKFADRYGGKIFDSYMSIVTSEEIDALYIPLPPALHFYWACLALEHGKHVLVEKPAAESAGQALKLVEKADEKGVALHENYMFVFHNQLEEADRIIRSGEIGSIRLYRISFGFPRRAAGDFRYDKKLGGGALNDAGGYTLKYASRLLGADAEVRYAQLNTEKWSDADLYGSGALVNGKGVTAQIAFGMDNDYKCELEAWGSRGTLSAGRILTAPEGFEPPYFIQKNGERTAGTFPSDDAFKKSIEFFLECIREEETRKKSYALIAGQARLAEEFRNMAALHAERQDR